MRHVLAVMIVAMGAARAAAADPAAIFQQPWRWTDERGETVSLARWLGQPVVLTLFYRSCEVRCAPTVERLRRLQEAFARKGRRPQFVLVTLDPRNDTPTRLRAFKKGRRLPEESWHLLHGTGLQTRALTRLLDFKVAGDDGHFEHETKIFLFREDGALQRTLHSWTFSDDEATAP
jgi:protein SCO1/2